MKKALRETQTLRAGRRRLAGKADPKNFAPPQTPFPGAQDGQNFISWRWSLYLYLQTQFGEDRCTQYRVIVVTHPQTNPQTHTHKQTNPQTGPITIHCAAKLSAQCNKCSTKWQKLIYIIYRLPNTPCFYAEHQ